MSDRTEALEAALRRCCEVIENDVQLLRREGFEGASWQLDAIRKARALVKTVTPLRNVGVDLDSEDLNNVHGRAHIQRFHIMYPTGKGDEYDNALLQEHGRAHTQPTSPDTSHSDEAKHTSVDREETE